MRFIIMLIVMLMVPMFAHADTIVYGKDFSFSIKELKGWISDIESGREQGINVALYEDGTTWADAPVVMYVNVTERKGNGLPDLVSYETANFKRACSEIKISKADILPKSGRSESRIFDCPTNNYEVVTYLEQKDKICILVMSGRNRNIVEAKLPAYKELVKGFTWLTSNVKFN